METEVEVSVILSFNLRSIRSSPVYLGNPTFMTASGSFTNQCTYTWESGGEVLGVATHYNFWHSFANGGMHNVCVTVRTPAQSAKVCTDVEVRVKIKGTFI